MIIEFDAGYAELQAWPVDLQHLTWTAADNLVQEFSVSLNAHFTFNELLCF